MSYQPYSTQLRASSLGTSTLSTGYGGAAPYSSYTRGLSASGVHATPSYASHTQPLGGSYVRHPEVRASAVAPSYQSAANATLERERERERETGSLRNEIDTRFAALTRNVREMVAAKGETTFDGLGIDRRLRKLE
ncbi:hypothetical protein KIPB_013841, partial [Kipferlia bialata]|eukprot:g13841.t1